MFSNSRISEVLLKQAGREGSAGEAGVGEVSQGTGQVDAGDVDEGDTQWQTNKNEADVMNSVSAHTQAQQQVQFQLQQATEQQPAPYHRLKEHLLTIERIAGQETAQLRAELREKDEQIDKLIETIQAMKKQQQSLLQFVSGSANASREVTQSEDGRGSQQGTVGVQTEEDFSLREMEVKLLKEAVVRHIRMNKELVVKMHPCPKENRREGVNRTMPPSM